MNVKINSLHNQIILKIITLPHVEDILALLNLIIVQFPFNTHREKTAPVPNI